jgi:uncharacterized protein YegP (UPF0339 family)
MAWTISVMPQVQDHSKGEITVAGKFEIFKDKSAKFRFRLKASNGEIIAVGEAYESKAAAKNGVESVKKNAADATVVDLTE